MFINFRFGSVNSKTVGYMVSYQIHAKPGEVNEHPPYLFASPHNWSSAETAWLIEIMIDPMHVAVKERLLYSTNPQRGEIDEPIE